MNINDLDLDRGFFQLTLPYRWQYWVGWVFGMLMVLVGAVANPLIALFGLLVVALCSPGSLEADLHKVRKAAPQPEDLEKEALEKGFSIDSWWMGRTSYTPTTDPKRLDSHSAWSNHLERESISSTWRWNTSSRTSHERRNATSSNHVHVWRHDDTLSSLEHVLQSTMQLKIPHLKRICHS